MKQNTNWIVVIIMITCVLIFMGLPFVMTGVFFFKQFKEMSEVHVTSYTDKFKFRVTELKSDPENFLERVSIECEGDMHASLAVVDLKKAGIFETNDSNGQTYYREGNPFVLRDVELIKAKGKTSSCEILFTVLTTPKETAWHSEISGKVFETSFSEPLKISGIQTNWNGTYTREYSIPLAYLGDYKILLSVK